MRGEGRRGREVVEGRVLIVFDSEMGEGGKEGERSGGLINYEMCEREGEEGDRG